MTEFYTTQEFAELLSIHRRTVVNLIHAKKINAVNISVGLKPTYRIYKHELERFMAENYTKFDEIDA